MKKLLTLLTITVTIGLSACSHKNPMETQTPEETAKFLIKASTYAEVKYGYKINDHGIIYAGCLLKRYGGQIDSKEDCDKFYNYMIEYAHQSSSPYNSLTLEDLTNQKVFDSIHDEYSRLYRKQSIRK